MATKMSESRTVIVGRGSQFAGITAVLEDLAAIGLLDSVVIIPFTDDLNSDSPVRVVHGASTVAGVRQAAQIRDTTLSDARINSAQQQVDVLILNSLEDPVHVAGKNITQLRTCLGTQINVVNMAVVREGIPQGVVPPRIPSIPNLVLSPEDSRDPESSPVTFNVNSDPSKFFRHCAANVASLAGLWTGSDRGVIFTHLTSTPNGAFQLVRSFYHRIAATGVQETLRHYVFDTDVNPLPLITVGQQQVAVVRAQENQVSSYNKQCVDELVAAHPQLFRYVPVQADYGTEEIRSSGQVSLELAGKITKEVFAHPATWIANIRDQAQAAADAKVQELAYGTENSRVRVGKMGSTYEPTNIGVDFLPKSFDEQQEIRQMGTFWQHYRNMALSMVDGHARPLSDQGPALPQAAQRDNTVVVVPNARHVIPAPEEQFGHGLPYSLKQQLPIQRVAVYDYPGFTEVQSKLQSLPAQRQEVDQAFKALDRLKMEQQHTFAAQTVARMSEHRDKARATIESLVQQLQNLRNQEINAEGPKPLEKLARFLGWMLSGSAIIFALLVFLWPQATDTISQTPLFVQAYAAMSGEAKTIMWSLWIGVWLILYLTQISMQVLRNHRLLGQRERRGKEIQACLKNLEQAAHMESRFHVAIKQAVPVSDLIGAVINKPFGAIAKREVVSAEPGNELSDSVLLGRSTPSDDSVKSFGDNLRVDFFTSGWMNDQMSQALREARQATSVSKGQPIDNSDYATMDYFNKLVTQEYSSESELAAIVNYLVSPSFRNKDRCEDEWQRMVDRINTLNQGELSGILRPIHDIHGNQVKVGNLNDSAKAGTFNAKVLSTTAQARKRLNVDAGFLSMGAVGVDSLGSSTVSVQLSDFFEWEDDLACTQPVSASPQAASQPIEQFSSFGSAQPNAQQEETWSSIDEAFGLTPPSGSRPTNAGPRVDYSGEHIVLPEEDDL